MTATQSTSPSCRTPILLLKTRSHPTDTYATLFAAPTSHFTPTFIPVLQHTYLSSAISTIQTLLLHPSQLLAVYDGLIFTSQRAVEAFAHALSLLPPRSLPALAAINIPLYTVGPATSRALSALRDTFLPRCPVLGADTGNGQKLAEYILIHHGAALETTVSATQRRLLFLVGEQRRDVIPITLMDPALGEQERIDVHELEVYGTKVMDGFREDFERVLEQLPSVPRGETKGWVCVFSPTGCAAMLRTLGWIDEDAGEGSAEGKAQLNGLVAQSPAVKEKEGRKANVEMNAEVSRRREASGIRLATIGPTTRDYLLREFGCGVDVCAEKPSPEGLREGIERWEGERKSDRV